MERRDGKGRDEIWREEKGIEKVKGEENKLRRELENWMGETKGIE
jgi:hypothetical protein